MSGGGGPGEKIKLLGTVEEEEEVAIAGYC